NQDDWIREAAKEYFASKDQLLTFALAAQGPEFTSFEVVKAQWELARELDARITVHVGVGRAGRQGKVGQIGKVGVVKNDKTYVHCTTLGDDDIKLIVGTGGTV